jgi:hypothetical protein
MDLVMQQVGGDRLHQEIPTGLATSGASDKTLVSAIAGKKRSAARRC